jgi:uncharacterized protein
VKRAMPLLSDIDHKAVEMTDICRDIAARKEHGDEIADQGVKALLENGGREPMAFIASSTIYGHPESVVDRMEEVADSIHDVVIDHI